MDHTSQHFEQDDIIETIVDEFREQLRDMDYEELLQILNYGFSIESKRIIKKC